MRLLGMGGGALFFAFCAASGTERSVALSVAHVDRPTNVALNGGAFWKPRWNTMSTHRGDLNNATDFVFGCAHTDGSDRPHQVNPAPDSCIDPSVGLQLQALAAIAPIAIFQSDSQGNFVYANEAWQNMSGQTLAESIGSGWLTCIHPDDRNRLKGQWDDSIRTATTFEAVYRLVHKSGEVRHVRSRGHHVAMPDTGQACLVGCAEDITDQMMLESRLEAAAKTDQLTGLPNRDYLLEQVRRTLANSEHPNHHFALMFLDFDHFKSVNDSWGHDIGDELLRQIANRIRVAIRAIRADSGDQTECTASRFGGDEFVLLFNGIDSVMSAEQIARQIHASLAEPYRLGRHETCNSASIGIVVGPANYERAEDILRDADTAMYEAKRAGRDRMVFFDSEMHTQVHRRLQIKNSLRSVIETDQLELNYQPIVSLQTGEVSAVEALVRWSHPELGWIGPTEFIPIAQESGLILELGEWVLREGCRQLAEWKTTLGNLAPRQISINLARKQFGDLRMLEVVSDALRETGLEPHELQLEVTEDAFAMDVDDAVETMRSIRALGVKLAIDDFGSGTSSFVALHRFPVDVLKVDPSLISEIEHSTGEAAMLHGLVVMSRNLGIKLVVEGIETSNQARAVQDLGCEFMQGYFFARPMSADKMDEFMITHQCMDWCEIGAVTFAQAWSQRLMYHIAPRDVRDESVNPIW